MSKFLNDQTENTKKDNGYFDLRQRAQNIHCRAESLLNPKQLAMISLYYNRGASCKELGSLLGKSQGQICRNIQMITKKLTSPETLSLLNSWKELGLLEKRIIRSNIFEGLSLQKTAALHGCSVRKVRAILDAWKGL